MVSIQASVGKVNGTRDCYNLRPDREKVRLLLNTIPKRDGGAGGLLAPDISPPGRISDKLYQAILAFQTFHAASPHRLLVDGHVDPHGKTIDKLNWSGKSATLLVPPTIFLAPTVAAGKLTKSLNNATNSIRVSLPGGFNINFTLTAGPPGVKVTIRIDVEGVLSSSYRIDDLNWGLPSRTYSAYENAIDATVPARVKLDAASTAPSFSVDFDITLFR